MRRKFTFASVIIVIIVVLGSIITTKIKNNQENNIIYEVEYYDKSLEVADILEDEENMQLYVLDKNKYVLPLDVKINKGTLTEQATQLFEKYTSKANTLPLGIISPLTPSTKLINIKINDDSLTLNLTEEFLNYNEETERRMLESLAYTFTQFPKIEKTYIQVNNQKMFYSKNGYPMYKGLSPKMNINLRLNTNDPLNSKEVIVYYISQIKSDNYLIPVTYLVDKNVDKSAFITKCLGAKTIAKLDTSFKNIINVSSVIEINENLIEVNLSDNIFNEYNNKEDNLAYKQLKLSFLKTYKKSELRLLINGEEIQ